MKRFATEQNAHSRETSIEILAAIESLATSDAERQRIWEEPTHRELDKIQEALRDAGIDPKNTYWGEAKTKWSRA